MEKVIEIPADAKTVTLELKKDNTFTLRTLLPQIKGDVELVVVDEFKNAKHDNAEDLYRLKAKSGPYMLEKLLRSRIVEGEFLLDQVPSIQREDPTFSLFAGTFGVNTGTGCIQLWVCPPVPDEED